MRRLLCTLGLALLGCGGAQTAASEPLPPPRRPPIAARPPSSLQEVPTVDAGTRLAVVPAGTAGPYLSPVSGGWLAVWLEAGGERGTWTARKLDLEGRAPDRARVLAAAGPDVRLRKLLDLGEEVLVIYSQAGAGEFGAFSVAANATLSSPTLPLANTSEDVIWVDAVRTDGGALVFWATRAAAKAGGRESAANVSIYATRWRPGAPPREPVCVTRHAYSWQVAPTADGALLATISSPVVELTRLDANATIESSRPLPESERPQNDLDLVRVGSGFVLGYTRQGPPEQIVTQRLSGLGESLGAPVVAVADSGAEPRLVRLVESNSKVLVVWRSGHEQRARTQATWLGSGRPGINLRNVQGSLPSDFGTTRDAVGWLLGGTCVGAQCNGLFGIQWLAQPLLETVQPWAPAALAEPAVLSPAEGSPVSEQRPEGVMLWGLSCRAEACAALSARTQDPVDVWVQVTTPAARPAPPPAAAAPATTVGATPRLTGSAQVKSAQMLAAPPDLADFAGALQPGGNALFAWVTHFDPNTPYVKPTQPAPDGRWAPVQAQLQTQWAPAGSELPPPQTISYRARSVSGIALAQKGNRALLAWTAIDGASPQVFTTLLDPSGKRVRQAVQTTKPGDVLRVGVSPLLDGWALAWIDDRASQASSYVAQLNDRLMRLSPDLQYPELRGAAVDLVLTRVSTEVWLLVVDRAGGVDRLVLQRFDAKAMLPVGSGLELAAGKARLSSPQLLLSDGKVWLLWVSGEGAGAHAWAQALDFQGHGVGEPNELTAGFAPTAVGGDCNGNAGCVFWVTEGSRDAASRRVLGGPLGDEFAAASLWQSEATGGVPLVRGGGSELWIAPQSGGLTRSTVDWTGTTKRAP